MDRLLDVGRLVEDGDELGVQDRCEPVELGVHAVRDVDDVGALRGDDLEREGGLAVDARDGLRRNRLDRDVGEVGHRDRAVGGGDGEGLDVLQGRQPGSDRDRERALGRIRLAGGERRSVGLQERSECGGLDLEARDVCGAEVDRDALRLLTGERDVANT